MRYAKVGFLVGVMLLVGIGLSVYAATKPLIPLAAAGSTFLENEAGITAYGRFNNPVDLAEAEQAFDYVEDWESEYIIGVVGLPHYGEEYDVHVYVDTAGWVAAYYLNRLDHPASRIIDWKSYSGGSYSGSKLENAILKVADKLGQSLSSVTYYDFSNPDATHMTIIIDEVDGNSRESFDVLIPCSETVYRRAWAHAFKTNAALNYGGGGTSVSLDGNVLSSHAAGYSGSSGSPQWYFWEGAVNFSQLGCGIYHTISVANDGYYSLWSPTVLTAYVGLVLVWKE